MLKITIIKEQKSSQKSLGQITKPLNKAFNGKGLVKLKKKKSKILFKGNIIIRPSEMHNLNTMYIKSSKVAAL